MRCSRVGKKENIFVLKYLMTRDPEKKYIYIYANKAPSLNENYGI